MPSSRIVRPTLAALFALGSVVAVGSPARATPTFPDVLARELGLPAPPDCSLCHAGGASRRGTVTTPFGAALRSRGLVAYDERSLTIAIAALTAERKDSDGDGIPDIEELKAGDDPNVAAGEDVPPPPEYGCSVGRRHEATPVWLLAAIAVGVLGWRRARQR